MPNCLNCGSALNDKYCAHCGQKAAVSRLTWHSLAEEVFHFFTHIEKGFFRTAGLLIARPGQLFKDYLDGRRKNYHKPVSFLLIWIALFLLVFNLANKLTHFQSINTASLVTYDVQTWMAINKYRSLIEVLVLPFTAFVTWMVVARPKLNYVEVLSVSFYIVSFLFILLCLQLVIALLLSVNFRTNTFDLISVGIFLVWIFYAGYNFYSRYRVRFLIPRMLLSLTLGVLVYFMLSRWIAQALIAMHLA